MNEEEERREKRIDRQWGLLDAIAQGYCQNPEFASTDYEPLADMIVRTAMRSQREFCRIPESKQQTLSRKGTSSRAKRR